jgi:hypothetical protein
MPKRETFDIFSTISFCKKGNKNVEFLFP